NGSIANVDLGTGSVTGAKVQDGSLTSADIAASDGSGGTLAGNASFDPPSIAPNTCALVSAAVGGVQSNDHVIVNVPPALEDGLTAEAATPAAGNLRIRVCNTTESSTIDGANLS